MQINAYRVSPEANLNVVVMVKVVVVVVVVNVVEAIIVSPDGHTPHMVIIGEKLLA